MKPTTKKIRREEMKRTKTKDRTLPPACDDGFEKLIRHLYQRFSLYPSQGMGLFPSLQRDKDIFFIGSKKCTTEKMG